MMRMAWMAVALFVAACGGGAAGPDAGIAESKVDEGRTVIFSARNDLGNYISVDVRIGDRVVEAGSYETVVNGVQGPVVAVLSAAGHLDEPVLVGRDQGRVRARLWRNRDNRRWSYHAGGDVNFGGRLIAPARPDSPLHPERLETDAAALVSSIAPLFKTSTVRTLNLEAAVTHADAGSGVPGKTEIHAMPPETLAGVAALAPSVTFLANEHARDFGDAGILATREALREAGLAFAGASPDPAAADQPVILRIGGQRVAFYAITTLDGDLANFDFPRADDPVPADLDPAEAWQYEERVWGYQESYYDIPEEARRIGAAWREIRSWEPYYSASHPKFAALWESAIGVYPELQDWVARRGHGGAAFLNRRQDAFDRLAEIKQDADVIIVNLHGGFRHQDSPSFHLRNFACDLIDAGATLVVGHHTEVLQGAEFYREGLIVHSVGTLVSDSVTPETESGAILRAVFEGDRLLEARYLPVVRENYRPVPAVDEAGRQALYRIWDRSLRTAFSYLNDDDGGVRARAVSTLNPTIAGQLRIEGNSALLDPEPLHAPRDVIPVLAPGEFRRWPASGLVAVRRDSGEGTGIEIGRDLAGWGHFEDVSADGEPAGGVAMALNSVNEKVIASSADTGPAYRGTRFLRLRRQPDASSAVLTRPRSRIRLTPFQVYRNWGASFEPTEPAPSYSLRLSARLSAPARAGVRADFDLEGEPRPRRWEAELDIPADGRWHEVTFDIPASFYREDDVHAETVMPYFTLAGATDEVAELDIDEFQFIDWRDTDAYPPGRFGAFDFVRNLGSESQRLPLERLSPGE